MSLEAWGDEPPDAYIPEIESDEDAIAADAEEFTSTDRYSDLPCSECGGPVRIVGGYSGDAYAGGRHQAVDVIDYRCDACGDAWSE